MDGILGGFGAYAGIELCRRIMSKVSAKTDGDFPQLMCLNVSSNALGDAKKLTPELYKVVTKGLQTLQGAGCTRVWIPCMSIHAMLPELEENFPDLIQSRPPRAKGLVLSSAISREYRIFGRDTTYVTDPLVDALIMETAMSGPSKERSLVLANLIKKYINDFSSDTIVLGCTELSLLNQCLPSGLTIIDPLDIMAQQIVNLNKAGC